MIDTHTHLGQLVWDNPGLKPYQLLRWMDRNGIEEAVVMAVEVPEELDFFVPTKELLRMTKRHRDRLHPLCAVDPRHRYPGRTYSVVAAGRGHCDHDSAYSLVAASPGRRRLRSVRVPIGYGRPTIRR